MAVLIVLFGALLLYRTLGALGLSLFRHVGKLCALRPRDHVCLYRHFLLAPMKEDLIATVPRPCPIKI